MTQKQLINLPLGTYELADRYYTYTLKKHLSEETGWVVYNIKEKRGRENMCLFEKQEEVFADVRGYKRTVLTAVAGVGAISIHGECTYRTLKDLRLCPKSSYLKTFGSIHSPQLVK